MAKLLIGTSIIVALLVSGYFLVLKSSPRGGVAEESRTGSFSPLELRARWRARIEKVGAARAYEELQQTYFEADFGTQHLAAHLFGELLFEKEGMRGLGVCDAAFSFGCYHSFFGKAISENGMEFVKALDRACVEAYGPLGTGCQHGIGHGILEYLGHDKLAGALDACTMTTQVQKVLGCTSGVFMEYNFPTLQADTAPMASVREVNRDYPYEPCNTVVPEQFRTSCYYELGPWWNTVFNQNYQKLGELCDGLTERYQESCFLGVGNVAAPTSQFNVEETIRQCKNMPDAKTELLCRAGAAWSFFAVPETRPLAPALCAGFTPEKRQQCIDKSDLIGLGNVNS